MLYLIAPIIVLLLLCCYISIVPFYMLVMLFYKPVQWIGEGQKHCEGRAAEFLCRCFPETAEMVFVWLLFQPRAVAYCLFVAPAKITAAFCGEICRLV